MRDRQMYAMGQRVAKTLDGSRPGYAGPAGGQSSGGNYGGGGSGPAGGASAGGNYGGNSSGGTSPGGMSNTGGNNRSLDRGFQNALDKISTRQDTITNQNNTNYGQFFGSRVPTFSPPTFGQQVGNVFGGIGDYIKGGGLIGAGIRGLGSLFGGSTPSTGNVGPAGLTNDGTYGTVGDAIDAGRRNEPPREEGDSQGIMAAYNPNMLNVSGEVVDEVPVSQEEEDFKQRFRVANQFRQDKQGQLDPAILEMISKLYT